MAPLKRLGDFAELRVAADLAGRGLKVLLPSGEDHDYDLVVERPDGRFERVQVKYHRSDGAVIRVKCFSHSLTNGKVRATKHYTADRVDWIAVFDATTDRCYYVPSSRFAGHTQLYLRLVPARSGRRAGVNLAEDYLHF
jgi:hypothetical protein